MSKRETIDPRDQFHEELIDLVRRAEENGVLLEGGWAIDGQNGDPSWDIEIVEVAERSKQQ
ncbi:hypothetical protein [Haloarchaeobius sp. DFWS5]|uniref:hypothetical protein n=1 Tax=Haloarchaeobius sp. DFWS5 TaxID=3446114 RepID=UPI003EBF46E3